MGFIGRHFYLVQNLSFLLVAQSVIDCRPELVGPLSHYAKIYSYLAYNVLCDLAMSSPS